MTAFQTLAAAIVALAIVFGIITPICLAICWFTSAAIGKFTIQRWRRKE